MFSSIKRSFTTGKSFGFTAEMMAKHSVNCKWKYKLDDDIEKSLQEDIFKPKSHPGIIKPKTVTLPNLFIKSVITILEDQKYPKKQLLEATTKFIHHLMKKKAPAEQEELALIVKKIKKEVIERLSEKQPHLLNDKDAIKSQMVNQMKKTVYNWAPEQYDSYKSLLYLIGRSAAEYAALVKIFSELKSRQIDYKPKTLFDFGSGVGTVTWAANTVWPKQIQEYFNVDVSAEMNELADHILKCGKGEKHSILRGTYYRQFLPTTPTPYDLVVSAYTLLELPSLENRLESIKHLWNKTKKHLIIVEHGTYQGYKLINEARDFILSLGDSHVFGPCPHDEVCPRYLLNDGTPCNFEVKYYNFPFTDNSKTLRNERYSYVILTRGRRDTNDAQWPRLIRPTLLRHKHCVCNLCTKEGKIEQSVFTASKYGSTTYRCAKSSDWGDSLPVVLKESLEDETQNDID